MARMNVFVPLHNGAMLAFGPEVAGASNALAGALAGYATGDEYREGKEAYERQLEQMRGEHPGVSAILEAGGGLIPSTAIAKLIKGGYGVANILKNSKKIYPKRTREQWKADYEYGKQEFNKLRGQSPLKREGHPDAEVTGRISGRKIRQGNIPEKYDMLHEVPDIYANGIYHGPTAPEKEHGIDFKNFHWFEKDNKGIQVVEMPNKRVLYNVNPDVRKYLIEHPEKAAQLGIDVTKL